MKNSHNNIITNTNIEMYLYDYQYFERNWFNSSSEPTKLSFLRSRDRATMALSGLMRQMAAMSFVVRFSFKKAHKRISLEVRLGKSARRLL